jgi:hypothetical protein
VYKKNLNMEIPMKRICLALTLALLTTPVCFAEGPQAAPAPQEIFDETMDCGLNLEKLEECVKEQRQKGQGDSFCNKVKLYAGNKQKITEAFEVLADKSKDKNTKEMNRTMKSELEKVQAKYAKEFVDAGLKPAQIDKIPPLMRGKPESFKCKKVAFPSPAA